MTYEERFKFVEGQTYTKQVSVALWVAATAVLADEQSTTQEKAWANATLRGEADATVQKRIMIRVSGSPDLDDKRGSVTDALIQSVVDKLVPELIAESA